MALWPAATGALGRLVEPVAPVPVAGVGVGGGTRPLVQPAKAIPINASAARRQAFIVVEPGIMVDRRLVLLEVEPFVNLIRSLRDDARLADSTKKPRVPPLALLHRPPTHSTEALRSWQHDEPLL